MVELSPDGDTALVTGGGQPKLVPVDLNTDRLAVHLCSLAKHSITPSQWHQYAPDLPYAPACT